MTKNVTNYYDEARDDAWSTVYEYVDEMVEQWKDNGEVSDDLLNDYRHGDSYHHESHVDRDYRLGDAVELLDQLAEYEETDGGLWDGQEPRQAICTQAAYTYGNAVYAFWRELIEELNGYLSDLALPETANANEDVDTRIRVGALLIRLFAEYGGQRADAKGEESTLLNATWNAAVDGDVTAVLAAADWYEERNDPYRARRLRAIAAAY